MLKVPVAFVVGDCEGNDKLCGRFGTHQLGNSLVCRDCNCPTDRSDDPIVRCTPLTVALIQNARDDADALKSLSHHGIENAFHHVCFGGDPEGIHGCTPPEMLHLYQQGLYKYALEAFISLLTREQQRAFDVLFAKVADLCHRQSDRTFPRFTFPRGVTNLTRFTAAEQVGVTLVCFLSLSMQSFPSNMLKYNPRGKRYCVDQELVERCMGFKKLFEEMLCAEAWINMAEHSVLTLTNPAGQRITALMKLYASTVQRITGNGLKIPKFHQLKHMPRYILKFGSPQNFSTSRCESHHISLSKRPAKTAQKRDECFEQQVGQRIVDGIVLARATKSLLASIHEPITQQQNVTKRGTRFCVIKLEEDGAFEAIPYNRQLDPIDLGDHTINTFGEAFSKYFPTNEGIPCFTEHHRSDQAGNNYIFRSHPNYRGHPWHDWAFFSWDNESTESPDDGSSEDSAKCSVIPAKILFFFDGRELVDHPEYDAGLYAVVVSLAALSSRVAGSKILSKGRDASGNSYLLAPVDSIVNTALVVPNIGVPNEYLVVSPPADWPSMFI